MTSGRAFSRLDAIRRRAKATVLILEAMDQLPLDARASLLVELLEAVNAVRLMARAAEENLKSETPEVW